MGQQKLATCACSFKSAVRKEYMVDQDDAGVAITKKKLEVSNTPYLTEGPALRDTHNIVCAPRRLLKRPHPLFKGTIARSVQSHGPAMQAWYRALRDYGVCKWTSIQPLSTQSLSLASWLCTPHCPHHIETALWHCRHWQGAHPGGGGGGRVYILLDYRFRGRGGGIYILINITSVTFCIPNDVICLPNLIAIGAGVVAL